jgi:hypothetical protein
MYRIPMRVRELRHKAAGWIGDRTWRLSEPSVVPAARWVKLPAVGTNGIAVDHAATGVAGWLAGGFRVEVNTRDRIHSPGRSKRHGPIVHKDARNLQRRAVSPLELLYVVALQGMRLRRLDKQHNRGKIRLVSCLPMLPAPAASLGNSRFSVVRTCASRSNSKWCCWKHSSVRVALAGQRR